MLGSGPAGGRQIQSPPPLGGTQRCLSPLATDLSGALLSAFPWRWPLTDPPGSPTLPASRIELPGPCDKKKSSIHYMSRHSSVPGTALGLHEDKSHNVLPSLQSFPPRPAQPPPDPGECGWDPKASPPLQASKEATFLCMWL